MWRFFIVRLTLELIFEFTMIYWLTDFLCDKRITYLLQKVSVLVFFCEFVEENVSFTMKYINLYYVHKTHHEYLKIHN